MSKLFFKELYLFSSSEKKAKHVSFSPNRTAITSLATDGTDRGKSVIMKSLYHAMGADCFFEDKWDGKNKIYVLLFSVDETDYYIYRADKLFKVFDSEKKLLFSVVSRHDLANKLKNIIGFAVMLPPRDQSYNNEGGHLEIASPAYNYLLYYVDQDKQNGSQFSSFRNLSEYPDYKENVLFAHFGAFDDQYYTLIHSLERLTDETKQISRDIELTRGMLEKVNESIHQVSYSTDLDHLRADVNLNKNEYEKISNKLSIIRQKLIEYRNNRIDIEQQLESLSLLNRDNEKHIISLKHHICPFCKSHLDDTIDLRIKGYSISDDIILLSNNLQYSIKDINAKIDELEHEYSKWLIKLEEYESAMNLASKEINDVLRHRGYMEIKGKLTSDLSTLLDNEKINAAAVKATKKKLHKYAKAKNDINTRYYTLMLQDRDRFGLEGISPKSLERITLSFSAGGSNNPVATIIWYVNLIQLKHEFNPTSIDFPVVFDSPNNAETDNEKRAKTYQYICERIHDNQLIVSGIGLSEEASGKLFDEVILLDNNKYELLNTGDYNKYESLLFELTNKIMVD